MKAKYIIIAICIFLSNICMAQSKMFDKYADMDDVTSIYISKAMMSMISSSKTMGVSLGGMTDNIESLNMVSTHNTEIMSRMRKDFANIASADKHDELMRIRDGKSRVAFYAQKSKDKIQELIMIVDDESNYMVMQITGSFTLEEAKSIGQNINKSKSSN